MLSLETGRRPLARRDRKPYVHVVKDNSGILISCDLIPVPLNKIRVATSQEPTAEMVEQAKRDFIVEKAIRHSEQVGDIYVGKRITPGKDLLTSVTMKVHSVAKDQTLSQEQKVKKVSGMFVFVDPRQPLGAKDYFLGLWNSIQQRIMPFFGNL